MATAATATANSSFKMIKKKKKKKPLISFCVSVPLTPFYQCCISLDSFLFVVVVT